MLTSLHIENVAVIKTLDLDFSKGFTVLTGETGAGKSIILGSVRMLLGARTDRDSIRTGEEKATVEGLFSEIDDRSRALLNESGIAPDENGELLLLRTLTAEGRNTCKINGRAVPLSTLKAAGQILIGIHGQHDTQLLLSEDTHRVLLDRYGRCEEAFLAYREAYSESVRLKSRLEELLREEQFRSERIKKYKTAVKEIAAANLKPDEEELLEQRKKILRDGEKLRKQAKIVYRALYKNEKGGSAYDLLEIAQTALEQLSEVLPESEEYISRLTGFRLEMEEIAKSAGEVARIADGNPAEELNRIEDRLDLVKALKKKYGSTIEEILAYEAEAKNQLIELSGREEELRLLKERLEKAVLLSREKGEVLSNYRKKAAQQLEKAVNDQLRYLDLEKVVFLVQSEKEYTENGVPKLTPSGMDDISFLISSNPGEPPKPIADIASGGELSRIMLALKVALADKESTPSLIFDEIDTGISGKTSQKIGMKLREISAYTQVFCVTHSAQVAACGHHHFKIYKYEVDGRNRTAVEELGEADRIEELARIMGGIHTSDTVRAGARELLAEGQRC